MRIAHIAAEVSPFAKTGGLGDVVGALPIAQAKLGADVEVWMPYYRNVREYLGQRRIKTEWVMDPFTLNLGYRSHQIGLLKTYLPGSSVPVYLVGSDEHFDRPGIYDPFFGRDDGVARYSVFVRAVLEAMRIRDRIPAVLHAHDWHAALGPMALKWDEPRDPRFMHTVTVLTVHNLAYQGTFPRSDYHLLGLPAAVYAGVEWAGRINLLKGGLMAADAITGVSPTFAKEMASPEGGFGLDWVVRYREDSVRGILNGVDTDVWNPRVDKKLPHRFDERDFTGKIEDRSALLAMAGMDRHDRGMVVSVIGRLTEQKGYDLLFPVLWELLHDGIRVVLLGSGDPPLEDAVRTFTREARGRFWGFVGFSDELAHLIYAGADAFLMPSRFEPCGLGQLYAMAYGTPPIARRVGGLADTVIGYNTFNLDEATGFTFDTIDALALRDTVRFANRCYQDPVLWSRLMRNGMAKDFSWNRSAEAYERLYMELGARQ